MKLIASLRHKAFNRQRELELTFAVTDNWDINKAYDIDLQQYQIEIKQPTSVRSLQQNRKLWGIISELERKLGVDKWAIYCDLLEMANAKSEFRAIVDDENQDEIIEMIRNSKGVRGVRKLNRMNGIVNLQIYPGSSGYSIKEMVALIDYAIDYAWENGVDTEDFNERYQ